MHLAAIYIYATLLIYAYTMAQGVVWTWYQRRRADREDDGSFRPPISILKPVKGVDESLEENLESFLRLDYPTLQLVIGIADEDDPAIEIARRVQARHPDFDMVVHVGEEPIGRNPKVNVLHTIYPLATHDILLISDSNVVATDDYLRRTVVELRDPEVGLVSNPVVGVGEKTVAAAVENMLLSSFVACGNVGAAVVTPIDATIGKSMLFRREALDGVGGFRAMRNILAEDGWMGAKFREQGWDVRLSGQPVYNVNTTWSLRRTFDRHSRWAQIRSRLGMAFYPLDLPANIIWAATLFALFGQPGWQYFLPIAWVVKPLIDFLTTWGMRGTPPPWQGLLAVPVKDLIMLAVFFVPFYRSDVNWRGNELRVIKGTRLIDPEAYRRAKAMARAGHAITAPSEGGRQKAEAEVSGPGVDAAA